MAEYERTVHTSDVSIRVTDTGGKGMPLLMIHGSGSSHQVFAPQMRSRALQSYRLIALDLPGHGESQNATHMSTYSLPGLAHVVAEVMYAMGLGPSLIYGWSLGGHIALEMMNGVAPIAGVMISGAPPISRGPIGILRGLKSTPATRLATKSEFTEADVALFAETCFGESATERDFESIRRADGRMRRVMFRSMLLGTCADEKRVVETDARPLAVVNGSEDAFVHLRYIAALRYRNLWQGMCHVIPDAGHAPFRTHAETFNALLAQFADDVAAGQQPTSAPAPILADRRTA